MTTTTNISVAMLGPSSVTTVKPQHDRRKGVDRVEQQHEEVVEPARPVAGEQAERQADAQRDADGR